MYPSLSPGLSFPICVRGSSCSPPGVWGQMVQSLGRAAVPARLLRASREQAPTCRADRVTAPAFLCASVSPRAERVSQLLASGGFRARPSATFQAASLEGWLHTGPCWEGSCLQPCLWRDGGSRWAARPGRHPSSAAPGCSVPSLGLSFTFRAMGTPPPPSPGRPEAFHFLQPRGCCSGSGGVPWARAAPRGHSGPPWSPGAPGRPHRQPGTGCCRMDRPVPYFLM